MFTPHVSLIGTDVRLEPLSLAHAKGLLPHALEPEIWLYIPYGNINTLEKLQNMISGLLRKQETGSDLCYTVFHQASNQPIGMTRYISVDRSNYGVEIGGTWYGKDYRRSAVNTEAKYLLLRHAFEVFACQRVQIQSDVRNERSQRAIERLGAMREGIMRKNKRMPDGHQRNSIMYSIIDDEWPAIKAKLEGWLQKSQL